MITKPFDNSILIEGLSGLRKVCQKEALRYAAGGFKNLRSIIPVSLGVEGFWVPLSLRLIRA